MFGVSACAGWRAGSTRVEPVPGAETVLVAEPLAPPITLSFEPAAIAYNEVSEPIAATRTPLVDAARAAIQEAAGGRIAADPRLDLACSQLAAVASRDAPPSDALVALALHSRGVVEPAYRVLIAAPAPGVREPDGVAAPVATQEPASVIAELRSQLAGSLVGRVGVAAGANGTVVAILVRSTDVELAPTPRALVAGGGFDLVATLGADLHAPRVSITHPDGAVEHPVTALGSDRVLRARFECGPRPGRHQLEIHATGPGGDIPRVAIPIDCGDAPPSSFAIEPAANLTGLATAADIERRLTSIINRQRATAGLPPLRTDLRIADWARRYTEAARDAPASSDPRAPQTPMQRLNAAGVSPLFVHELTSTADSIAHAAELVTNDATWRAALASAEPNHVGLGVAVDDQHRLHLALTLVLLPPAVHVRAAAQRLADAIATQRACRVDLALSTAAQRYASGLTIGRSHDEMWPAIQRRLNIMAETRYSVAVAAISLADIERASIDELVRGRRFEAVGVGVAQSARFGPQAGIIWIVVFFGHR
jgi:hypothetical protein